ncbi:hypothetical protein GYMLUDRAFT_77635 [Collybiopsis luxurians FD-317 M1]|uniref:Uncharacterized protein n=1 Tax=Collybiopsis luxurians FD-317 M1 TaxID=944289 RepID=A0A0D0ARK0_9AGAR|nr:hypothetical protein GYMLUDRAFT_77635 [Collybiopsis luxurians FD-317 M1]
MAPAEYSLRFQKGITGGIILPLPSLVATITRPKNSDILNIAVASRVDGTPDLGNFVPKTLGQGAQVKLPGSDTTESAEALMDELYRTLKELPTEQPPGSEDIYGLDTSIFWGSSDFQWFNGGESGVSGFPGSSSVQATPAQKAQFKRAVEIVKSLVDEAK